MKSFVLAIAALGVLSAPAAAQTVACRTEVGRTTCHDVYGNIVTGTKDALGNTIWTDQYGEQVKVRRDAMGNIVVKDGSGKTTRCRVDAMGKSRCR